MIALSIFMLMLTAQQQAPAAQPALPACAAHPAVDPDAVAQRAKARQERAGDDQASEDRQSRPKGHDVGAPASSSGGDCAPPNLLRGQAAAAVGALLYDGEPRCSAVLIKSTMIITAAHCVQNLDFARIEFALGADVENPDQRAGVDNVRVHPKYDDSHLGVHDIAYAYLKKRMTEARPLDIPDETWRDSAHLSLMHVGYGIAGPKVGARRCVNIPVKDFCDNTFSHETPQLNTCHGDSGGGIFRDLGARMQLVGLTGWGDDACEKFGVNVDVARYREWIGTAMLYAPRNVTRAPIAQHARKVTSVKPDKFFADVSEPRGEQLFENKYLGLFVTWDAKITTVRRNVEIPHACDLRATAGPQQDMWLFEYPGGCTLERGETLRFTGRLAGLKFGGVEIVDPEPVEQGTTTPPPALPPVGTYTLAKLLAQVKEVRETQTQDLRLESGHGSWSGRVKDCRQVNIAGPVRLDRQAPIVFNPAYQNHAGYEAPQNITDQGFCIPLWAEGFGGVQLFGTTVDAGQTGVVSGTVVYGIVRSESSTVMEVVRTGEVPGGTEGVTVDLPTDGQYVVTVKLPDGGQETIKGSGTYGAIEAIRSDKAIQLRPRTTK